MIGSLVLAIWTSGRSMVSPSAKFWSTSHSLPAESLNASEGPALMRTAGTAGLGGVGFAAGAAATGATGATAATGVTVLLAGASVLAGAAFVSQQALPSAWQPATNDAAPSDTARMA